MPPEPVRKRTVAFIDGQNLYHAAREAFGSPYPNSDVLALGSRLCVAQGWDLSQVRFYTGIPAASDNAFWHHVWSRKLAVMGRQGICVFSRQLRYRNHQFRLPDGRTETILVGEEKGVDIRIALDVEFRSSRPVWLKVTRAESTG